MPHYCHFSHLTQEKMTIYGLVICWDLASFQAMLLSKKLLISVGKETLGYHLYITIYHIIYVVVYLLFELLIFVSI